jgi:hypothetical protein
MVLIDALEPFCADEGGVRRQDDIGSPGQNEAGIGAIYLAESAAFDVLQDTSADPERDPALRALRLGRL